MECHILNRSVQARIVYAVLDGDNRTDIARQVKEMKCLEEDCAQVCTYVTPSIKRNGLLPETLTGISVDEINRTVCEILTPELVSRVKMPPDLAKHTGTHGLDLQHNERYRQVRQMVWNEFARRFKINPLNPNQMNQFDIGAFNSCVEGILKRAYYL